MTGRWIRAAQLAVLSAPLRTAASTTTVPLPSAAITRLRARNRVRMGAQPGASSETTAPWPARWSRRSLMRRRVGTVDTAREHGHGRTVAGQRSPVCGLVDAERRAGDDRRAGPGESGRELGRLVGAIGRGRPAADDRDRVDELVQLQRTAHPEARAGRRPSPGAARRPRGRPAEWATRRRPARSTGCRAGPPGRGHARGRCSRAWRRRRSARLAGRGRPAGRRRAARRPARPPVRPSAGRRARRAG